ncbi:hypothetical protein GCK32_005025 [Trichostrongylus colubriformis]|uniref:Uncharacterized protein n=1 Tax=Trichostrongylus colubriformis TaxID=6319 RepID=A0AAN8EZE7_TRICO
MSDKTPADNSFPEMPVEQQGHGMQLYFSNEMILASKLDYIILKIQELEERQVHMEMKLDRALSASPVNKKRKSATQTTGTPPPTAEQEQYLRKFSYSNAQASDLWEVFDVVVKDVKGPNGNPLKVTEFAYQWTTQMGFPLVTVENFNATSLKVTQSRYKTNKEAQEREKYRHPKYGFKWDVPLWYQEGDNKEIKQTWLPREEPLYLHISDPNASLVVNADRHGFYRQNYDANGWRKIIQTLKNNHKKYMRSILKKIYGKSSTKYIADNYRNDSLFFENNLQKAVIGAYCTLESKNCTKGYKDIFDKEVMEKCKDGQEASECVRTFTKAKWKQFMLSIHKSAFLQVMALHNAESVQLEKGNLLRALGCHKDITALKGLLLLALDRNSSFVRLQDLRNLQKRGLHARDYGAFDRQIERSEHKVEWIKKHFRKLSDFFKNATS